MVKNFVTGVKICGNLQLAPLNYRAKVIEEHKPVLTLRQFRVRGSKLTERVSENVGDVAETLAPWKRSL
jgi:hypothetical protein